jgi:hypothetical protein
VRRLQRHELFDRRAPRRQTHSASAWIGHGLDGPALLAASTRRPQGHVCGMSLRGLVAGFGRQRPGLCPPTRWPEIRRHDNRPGHRRLRVGLATSGRQYREQRKRRRQTASRASPTQARDAPTPFSRRVKSRLCATRTG